MRHASRPLALGLTLLLVLSPALACGPAPQPARPGAGGCATASLLGDWVGDDGTRIRIIDSGRAGFSLDAHRLDEDGTMTATPVYTRLRHIGACRYLGQRHLDLDERVHASPPHTVALALDPRTGELADDYAFTTALHWRRADPR